LESNYECSQNVRDWWTDCDDGLRGCEGVLLSEPLGMLNDFSPIEKGCVQYDNTPKYIDPRLLARPEHEPFNCSPSVINQSAPEALAQVTQSQPLLNPTLPESQGISPIGYTEAHSDKQELDPWNFYNSSFPVPPYSSPPQSASPTRSDQISSDTPDGKIGIVATPKRYMCQTCQRSFATERQYQNHVRASSCHTPFNCLDCGRKFGILKDLQRHRGHTKAASSCSKVKTVGTFACTCSPKAYTRKDSLQRHLRKFAGEMPQQHRCKGCNHARCRCL
jgi:hypothetical protein